MSHLIPIETVERKILLLRGHKVLLDADLAELYGVETKALKRAVRRNKDRFPEDFMFQLSRRELADLRRHFGASSWGGLRYSPFAFTEQGVAMLSGALNSTRAVQVNIAIMRAFVRLRAMVSARKELARKLSELERKIKSHDQKIEAIFDAIRELMSPPAKHRPAIGFRP